MKKIIKFLAITLSAFILFGCPKTSDSLNNQTDSSDTQPESESPDTNHEIKHETFKEISVFNPTENTVKLVAEPKDRSLIPESRAAATEICTVKSKEKKEVSIGSEHDYYFTDEVNIKIADLSKAESGEFMPVYLELNEPQTGKGATYLTETIKWQIGVIPYVPVHNNVVEYADGQLYGCYAESSCDTAPDKGNGAAAVYDVQHHKYQSARKGHRPVSIAAHDYFN